MAAADGSQDMPDDGGSAATGTPAQVRMRLISDDVRCGCCGGSCVGERRMLPMLLDRRGTAARPWRCCCGLPPPHALAFSGTGDGLVGLWVLPVLVLLLEKAARSEWPYHMSLFSSSSLSYRCLLWFWL